MAYRWIMVSALSGGTAVALGAFGAHLLRPWLPLQKTTIFETAVRYQMVHALALLAVAVLMGLYPQQSLRLRRSALAFSVGMLFFCGSLYIFALSDVVLFGWLTPVGGLLLLLGWGLLAHTFRKPPPF